MKAIKTKGMKLSALIEILQGRLQEGGERNIVAWVRVKDNDFICPLMEDCPIDGFFYMDKE